MQLKSLQDKIDSLKKENKDLQSENNQGHAIMSKQLQSMKEERDNLLAKYMEECYLRKKLHNQIEDMKGKVRVFCRVRPVSDYERDNNYLPIVTVKNNQTVSIQLRSEGH